MNPKQALNILVDAGVVDRSQFDDVMQEVAQTGKTLPQVITDFSFCTDEVFYQTIANAETGQANLWRWITIALFACGLAMAGATFFKFYHEPVNTDNTLAILVRLLYALAIAAPAFYTARESARHRTNADRARQTELELASLGPFIELMNEQDKEEIRKSLIPTYFGRPVDAHEIKTMLDVGGKK